MPGCGDRQAGPQGAGTVAADELALYLTRLFLPLPHCIVTADPSPENRLWLKAHLGKQPLRVVSRAALLAQLRLRFGGALIDQAVFGLARRFPELSAQTVITPAQSMILSLLAAAGLLAAFLSPLHAVRVGVAVLSLIFAASGVFRVTLTILAGRRRPPVAPSSMSLPTYTVLVPLYREAAVLPRLVASLGRLDYPRSLLDIKLVVEEDDRETVTAAQGLSGEDIVPFEIVAVPPGGPRTKPKAANYALAFARGEYLVVYDAEDRPEPDQLKKAVATFRAQPRRTACLQARLNFYNAEHNWLTNGIMAQTPLAPA